MAELISLVIIVVVALTAIIAFKILKNVLKAIMLSMFLLAIILGAALFLIVMDANDLRENLGNSSSLFLVTKDESVLTAVEFTNGGGARVLSDQDRHLYQEQLTQNKIEKSEEYYKIIILSTDVVNELEEPIIVDDRSYTRSEFNALANVATPEERADMYLPVFEKTFSDPLFLIRQYKKGNVQVIEETALFKALSIIPTSAARSLLEVRDEENT